MDCAYGDSPDDTGPPYSHMTTVSLALARSEALALARSQ
jgi:hypothetical protein